MATTNSTEVTRMNVMRALYSVCTCALAATMLAAIPRASWFEARTTGAKTLTLRGAAEFGSVPISPGDAPFVLALGASSTTGAVLFTIPTRGRPEPGVYDLADSLYVVRALVITGSPTHPTGAFRGHAGALTITRSTDEFIAGHFELRATGFETAEPDDETRQIVVTGVFTASPGQ
jgi:hypothetical protein